MKTMNIAKRMRILSVILSSILLLTQVLPVSMTFAFDEEPEASFEVDLMEDAEEGETSFDDLAELVPPPAPEPETEAPTEDSHLSEDAPAEEPDAEVAADAPDEEAPAPDPDLPEAPEPDAPTEPSTETPSEPVTEAPTDAPAAEEPADEPVDEPAAPEPSETSPVDTPSEPETPTEPPEDEITFSGSQLIPPTVDFIQAGPLLGVQTAVREADIQPGMQARSMQLNAEEEYVSNVHTFRNGIGMGKSVTDTSDPDVKRLRLETFTSGTVTSEEVGVPLDIVLVLDTSGSMAWNFDGTGNTNARWTAMKNAVTTFVDEVRDHAQDFDITHRVGIASYAASASTVITMSPLKSNSQRNTIISALNGIASPSGSTRIDLGVGRGLSLLNNMGPPDPAWNDPPGVARQRVMIVFTDGYPTSSNGFEITVANDTLNAIQAAKGNTTVYSVGIFEGANPNQMFGSTGFANNSNGAVNDEWYNTLTQSFSYPGTPEQGGESWRVVSVPAANRFMNYLSSNSLTASSLGLSLYNNTRVTGSILNRRYHRDYGYNITASSQKNREGYYLSASDADALNDVFRSIADSIANPTVELPTATTQIRDTVSDYFRLPAGMTASDVSIRTYESLGQDGSGNWIFSNTPNPLPDPHLSGVTATITGKQVAINGYDFNANYVTEEPKDGMNDYGRKIVFEFNIEREPTFFGGNAVPTNEPGAGLYNTVTNQAYDSFGRVVTDLVLKYDFEVEPQAIYLGNQVNLAESVFFTATGGISYRPDGFNNSYSNIQYHLYDGPDLIATYSIPAGTDLTGGDLGVWTTMIRRPTENQLYDVRVTMQPSIVRPAGVDDLNKGPKSFGVQIYRPHLSADDTEIYLGEILDMEPLYTGNVLIPPTKLDPITWHMDTTGGVYTSDLPLDGPPDVELRKPNKMDLPATYDLNAFAPTVDTPFDLDVFLIPAAEFGLPEMEIFETSTDGRHAAPSSDFEFWILLKTGSLTIIKHAKDGEITDPNQSFIFDVTRTHDGVTTSWRVVIQGTGSKTITGLPLGTYTVTEDVEWSWRYTPDHETQSSTLTKVNPDRSVTFKNTRTDDSWLTGDNFVINVFASQELTATGPSTDRLGGVNDDDKKRR